MRPWTVSPPFASPVQAPGTGADSTLVQSFSRSSSSVLPILLSLALAAAASLLLCACGGGTPSARAGGAGAGAATAAPIKDPGSTPGITSAQTPTRALALAFASTVNLSTGDIPEASIAAWKTSHETAREREEYRACEHGFAHQRSLLERSSPRLERGRELEVEDFASAVAVVRDERTIAQTFRALQAPGVRACLARAFTRNFSVRPIREARWGRFTVTKLPLSAPGASATFGIRVSGALSLPYNEVTVPVYIDMVGFALGHGAVALTAGSVTQPVPTTTEQELVALLLARAKAHAL